MTTLLMRRAYGGPVLSHESEFVPSTTVPETASEHAYFHVVGGHSAALKVWRTDVSAGGESHFLGMWGERACWAVAVDGHDDPSDGAALDLYSLYGRASDVEWALAGRAVQIVEWARTHRFCGRCATATEPQSGDRSMRCAACGLLAYPRLAPAMITLVTRGEGDDEEALLARGTQFRLPMYSCLAGFVEPGESLEQAVVREVREEVGVAVDSVRYLGSQPWPFPHSLMIGFAARYVSGEIECDPAEIVDAGWFRRDALPPIPPPISIARKIIDQWLAGSPERVS
jgi:NAD+ diphosphatase